LNHPAASREVSKQTDIEIVGWVERSDTHQAVVAMGIGLDGLNPSYAGIVAQRLEAVTDECYRVHH